MSINGCWGLGASMMTTSQCLDFKTYQLGTIKEVIANGATKFEEITCSPISLEESYHFSSEVSLLLQNVLFTQDNKDDSHGGHLTIIGTPSNGKP